MSKNRSFSFYAAFAVSLVSTMPITTSSHAQTTTAKVDTPDVVLSTRANPAASPISPLLGGAQFNFFDPPIRDHRNSEALLGDWKSAKVSVLRYPGGTWGDHYVWDHPEKSYFAAPDSNENTIITPAQFIEMCRKTSAEPIFQANALVRGRESSNWINPTKIETIREGAKWTAEWVRQVNLVNKWNVKYWEIGNELWILYRPEEYATVLKEYSKAMKAVDPSIKIIACGLSSDVGPFDLPWWTFKDDPTWKPRMGNTNDAESWNKALFTIAKGSFDYIAPHPYISARNLSGKDLKDSREIYLQTTAKVWEQAGLESQYEVLRKYKSKVKVAVTEWNTNFNYAVPVQRNLNFPMYFYSQGNGVNTAHYMGQIVAGEPNEMAVLHSLDDIQTLYFWPKKATSDKPLPHPIYLALKLWNTHLGDRRAVANVNKQPTMRIGDKSYPATFTYASEDEQNVYLVAINLDPDKALRFQWQPQNVKGATRGVLSLMAGKSLDQDNWATWNQDVHDIDIRDSELNATGGVFNFELPAYSVAGITISKTGAALPITLPVVAQKSYVRWLAIGDSITAHGQSAPLQWLGETRGMAASSLDKDYVHILRRKLQERNPQATTELNVVGRLGKLSEGTIEQMGSVLNELRDWNADLVTIQLGENDRLFGDGRVEFEKRYRALVDTLLSGPKRPVIVCTGVWSPTDKPVKRYAPESGEANELLRSKLRSIEVTISLRKKK